MKNQTLEELIEEFRKKYVQHNPGNREVPPEDYVTEDAQELEAFIKKVYEAGGEAERVENKRLRSALDWIAIVSNEKNPHLGRPRSSDKTCIFCMAYLAINDGAYGEHIDYEALSKAKRDSWKKKEESK